MINDEIRDDIPQKIQLMNDYDLLRLCPYNENAFWELWARYENKLRTYCLKLTRYNHIDAEDLLSYSMLKANLKVKLHFEKIRNLQAWLYRLVQNTHLDNCKRNNRLELYPELEEKNLVFQDNLITDNSCNIDVYKCITDAIDLLPSNQKHVAIYYFIKRKTYSEIASLLSISPENARKRIHLARKTLIPILTEFIGYSYP